MNGILLVDKPRGWTSHDVVARIRSILKNEAGQKIRVGHSGTLDPMATGLLVLLIGKATKQQAELTKLNKIYEAEITLGATSDTDDAEGNIKVKSRGLMPKPDVGAIKKVLKEFTGEIEQVPPEYSAVHVGGKRAYQEARAGKTVELKRRKVTVHEIKLLAYHYPKLRVTTTVSSGTYIRSLARDVGQRFGTGGYLSQLRRTRIGPWLVKNSTRVEHLDSKAIKKSTITIQ